MFDLLSALTKFEPANDRESDVAFFRTHAPWKGSEAYLNIIFKPADKEVLADVAAHIRIPAPWVQFLARNNGAILFSSYLYVMGVVAKGTLLNRRDNWSLPPINIEQSNVVAKPLDLSLYLIIASYGFDGSLACIDRNDLGVYVFHRREGKPYASWKSAEQWISSEVQRLSGLFDSKGKLLVDSSQTLPSAQIRVM
jgi:hypothetical protein